jgi:hypothetical protein
MKVRFAGQEVEVRDIISKCIAENYNTFGVADNGEADMVAARLLSVLDDLGLQIERKN